MTCRDNRKDLTYFDKYISDQEKRIHRFEDVRTQLSDEERIKDCNMILANLQRDMFYAKFSAGYSKDDLNSAYHAYIDQMLLDSSVSYDELANAIAINIFLDADRNKDLLAISSNVEKDALIDALLGISGEHDHLIFKDNYGIFFEFLNDDMSKEDFIRYINDEWYTSCKDLYWYDSLNSNSDTYVGYWCWIAAAICKMKGLTIDNIYIPKV